MPSLYSHGNTNVSKIWFVVVLALIAMVGTVWKLFNSLQEVALHSTQMSSQIEELMNDPR